MAFMEHDTVEVIGDVGQRKFGFGPRQTDRADEQAVAGFQLRGILDLKLKISG